MPPDGPIMPSMHQLIGDPVWQTDVPHVFSFAINPRDQRIVSDPECSGEKTPECAATKLYGAYRAHPPPVDKEKECTLFDRASMRFGSGIGHILRTFLNKLAEMACPYNGIAVEMLMLCPRPHFFNSGSHRIMMMLWYKGERYVIAVEEKANLFAQGLTPGAKIKLEENPQYSVEILGAAMKEIIGTELHRKHFDIRIYDGTQDLLKEGCTPSPFMHEY